MRHNFVIMLKQSSEHTMELNISCVFVCEMEASYEEIFILLTRPNLSRTKLDKSDENSILLF